MKSVTRVSLIIAVGAGLLVSSLNLLYLKPKLTRLRSELQSERESGTQAKTALSQAQTQVQVISIRLKGTEAALGNAVEEKQKATTAANVLKVRLAESAFEKVAIGHERDEARQELARYKYTGLTPEEIVKATVYIRELATNLTKVQAQKDLLEKRVIAQELARNGGIPKLPVDLRGKVVAYDPKWRFVVLDIGGAQGALAGAELLISRQGKLVAKVTIARVENDRCIANLVPKWDLGEIVEGDVAIPAAI